MIQSEMPNAIEAENALIGSLIYDNLVYEKIADFLREEHFFDPLNKKIFKTIVHCINKGEMAKQITIWPYFVNDELLISRGGREYFENLTSSVFSITYAIEYGKQILDTYIRRQMIRIANEILVESHEVKLSATSLDNVEKAEQNLFELSNYMKINNSIQSFGTLVGNVVSAAKLAANNENKVVGVPTGFIDLDRYLGGLHKSDLLILAGRPSMGKTALATNIGFAAAKMYHKPVAFFSLEMSSEQLATRILAQEANISSDRIRKGLINSADINILSTYAQKIANVPFFIDDTPGLTISGLRTRARRLCRQEKVCLIIIDYLQLIGSASSASENRVQELSAITRSLKTLAKELNIPILALSQLSRAVEQRDDKRPQLADLRESGTIEQDADIVMFIFREAYYEARKKPPEGSAKMIAWQENMVKMHNIAELMIAKQRHGPIKNITLSYNDGIFGNYISDKISFN